MKNKSSLNRKRPRGSAARIFALILWVCVPALYPQTIIENPDQPPSPNAGRILPLKEVLRITDEAGAFYFKEPGDLWVAPDGTIFYGDWNEFLYKFDSQGKFLKNLIKKGEGPGEIRECGEFLLDSGEIILLDSMPNKIVRMDFDGKLIDEFSLGPRRFYKLLAFHDGEYYLADIYRMDFERKNGLKELGHDLYTVDRKGGSLKTPCSLPTMEALYFGERAVSAGTVTAILKAEDPGRYLYLSNTQDYLVKVLDLDKRDVVRTFRRSYRPVPFEAPARDKRWYRERGYPDRYNDIQKLVVQGDRLWVLTSTVEKDKGILTDVFDREGVYRDCFYLPLPRLKRNWVGFPPMAVSNSFLYTVEWDEDGTIFIVKYRIGEG
jgi:hypothetical protein